MIGEAGQGEVAAVLQPPDEAADLLDVLACGHGPGSPDLVVVGRIRQDPVQQFRRRDPIGERQPVRDAGSRARQHLRVLGIQTVRGGRRQTGASAPRRSRARGAAGPGRRGGPRATSGTLPRADPTTGRPGTSAAPRRPGLRPRRRTRARCRRRTGCGAPRAPLRTRGGSRGIGRGWRCPPGRMGRRMPLCLSLTCVPAASLAISAATESADRRTSSAATMPSGTSPSFRSPPSSSGNASRSP